MILDWGGIVSDTNTEDYVYGKLKNAIFKRYIRPDTRLVESKIAEQLGVSRTPVRGAIKRLAHDGFVKLSNNKGASIVKPTTKEIYDTFAVRAQLEKMAAAGGPGHSPGPPAGSDGPGSSQGSQADFNFTGRSYGRHG